MRWTGTIDSVSVADDAVWATMLCRDDPAQSPCIVEFVRSMVTGNTPAVGAPVEWDDEADTAWVPTLPRWTAEEIERAKRDGTELYGRMT